MPAKTSEPAVRKASVARLLGRAMTTAILFLVGIGLGVAAVFTVFYKLGGVNVCTRNGHLDEIRVGSPCPK